MCAASPNCFHEAVRRGAFARALRAPVVDADELARILFEPEQPNVRDWSVAGSRPGADRVSHAKADNADNATKG